MTTMFLQDLLQEQFCGDLNLVVDNASGHANRTTAVRRKNSATPNSRRRGKSVAATPINRWAAIGVPLCYSSLKMPPSNLPRRDVPSAMNMYKDMTEKSGNCPPSALIHHLLQKRRQPTATTSKPSSIQWTLPSEKTGTSSSSFKDTPQDKYSSSAAAMPLRRPVRRASLDGSNTNERKLSSPSSPHPQKVSATAAISAATLGYDKHGRKSSKLSSRDLWDQIDKILTEDESESF